MKQLDEKVEIRDKGLCQRWFLPTTLSEFETMEEMYESVEVGTILAFLEDYVLGGSCFVGLCVVCYKKDGQISIRTVDKVKHVKDISGYYQIDGQLRISAQSYSSNFAVFSTDIKTANDLINLPYGTTINVETKDGDKTKYIYTFFNGVKLYFFEKDDKGGEPISFDKPTLNDLFDNGDIKVTIGEYVESKTILKDNINE